MSLKNKNIVLLIGVVLICFICYRIPIQQTINAKNDYGKLMEEQQLFSNIPLKISALNKENSYLDSILQKYQFSSDNSFQSNLLHSITAFSETHKLTVVSFEEPHVYINNKTTLKTYSFTFRGDYTNSLKLLHELEQLKKMGEILHVNFEKKKNYKTNKWYLETTILLQRLIN